MKNIPILLAVSCGVLAIFSLSILATFSQEIFAQQLIFFVLGAVIFWLISRLDYRLLTNHPWLWYALTITLLLATMVIGSTVRGSTRWLVLGPLRFQPSEIVKPLLIVFAAGSLANPPRSLINWLKYVLVLALPVALIHLQPDLGSSVIIIFTLLGMLLASSVPVSYVATTIILAIAAVPLGWKLLKDYQKERLVSFLNPTYDPLGSGYHAIQATIAVGSGMLFGRGLGRGTQSQLKFLPERHTDFIFAAIAEELGFVGTSVLLLAYAVVLYQILAITANSKDEAGHLIAIGAFMLLLAQVVINAGMNMGLLPVTGITLPLVSVGGSSVIAIAATLGLVASVARNQTLPKPSLEIR